MAETVSLSLSPSSLTSAPTTHAEVIASVHQYTAGQKKAPTSLPQLPVRVSNARLETSNSSPSGLLHVRSLNRTGVQSKPNRSDPNDYVDDPGTPNRSGKPGLPVSTSESKSISRTECSDSKEKIKRTSVQERSCKESIYCPRCKLCRCSKCAESRPLSPIRCCQSRHCLPEELVVCLSCLWLPRAAFAVCQECSGEGELETSYEQFCSCSSPSTSCCRRWTCMATVVPCLPCLCLYWPLRWTLVACSGCNNCKRRGCRCNGQRPTTDGAKLEALLITDEPETSNYFTNASRD